MAHAARYHRGSLPKPTHSSFQRLSDETRETTLKIAAFLRLAEGLDRGHYQNISLMRTRLTPTKLEIVIGTKGDPQLEIWGGRRSGDLFEMVYGRKVNVSAEESATQPVAQIEAPAG